MQKAFNLIAEIYPDKKAMVEYLFKDIQARITDNDIIPFSQITTIHFARFVLLPEVKHEDGSTKFPPYLAFSTNYDGDLDNHLEEICKVTQGTFDQVFICCKDFPKGEITDIDRIAFMKRNSDYRAYFYQGSYERSVGQILEEEKRRQIAMGYIDTLDPFVNHDPHTVRDGILNVLKEAGHDKPYPKVIRPTLSLWQILQVIGTVILILACLIPFVLVLLYHEIRDAKKLQGIQWDYSHTQKLAQQEDQIVQNQLTHLVEVKPGWFRLFTLKMVLGGIAWLAKYYFNKGKLGNIPTIHFARWVLIDGGKRLLFFSNFDGSWESYLGDFIDKAAVGLTGVWSNTIGFPKTLLLLFQGARDEVRFKAWARAHQIPTQVWYSAYKDLSLTNINNNTAIQEGLAERPHGEALVELLERY